MFRNYLIGTCVEDYLCTRNARVHPHAALPDLSGTRPVEAGEAEPFAAAGPRSCERARGVRRRRRRGRERPARRVLRAAGAAGGASVAAVPRVPRPQHPRARVERRRRQLALRARAARAHRLCPLPARDARVHRELLERHEHPVRCATAVAPPHAHFSICTPQCLLLTLTLTLTGTDSGSFWELDARHRRYEQVNKLTQHSEAVLHLHYADGVLFAASKVRLPHVPLLLRSLCRSALSLVCSLVYSVLGADATRGRIQRASYGKSRELR